MAHDRFVVFKNQLTEFHQIFEFGEKFCFRACALFCLRIASGPPETARITSVSSSAVRRRNHLGIVYYRILYCDLLSYRLLTYSKSCSTSGSSASVFWPVSLCASAGSSSEINNSPGNAVWKVYTVRSIRRFSTFNGDPLGQFACLVRHVTGLQLTYFHSVQNHVIDVIRISQSQ